MPEGITAQKFQTLGPKLLTLNQGSAHEPVSKCFRLCGPYSLAQLLNSAVVAREHHAQWKWMGVAVCHSNAIFSDRQQVGFGPRDLFATSGSKLSSVRSCHQGSLGSGNISVVGLTYRETGHQALLCSWRALTMLGLGFVEGVWPSVSQGRSKEGESSQNGRKGIEKGVRLFEDHIHREWTKRMKFGKFCN